MKIFVAIGLIVVAGLVSVRSQTGNDALFEQRLQNLTRQLRCLQCRNETVADSPAQIADDLRKEIREQMKSGKSDDEIIAFLHERYGDFILYNPPVKATTYLLWFGPFLLLIGGTLFLFRFLKQRRAMIEVKPLTAEERRRAANLLREM